MMLSTQKKKVSSLLKKRLPNFFAYSLVGCAKGENSFCENFPTSEVVFREFILNSIKLCIN